MKNVHRIEFAKRSEPAPFDMTIELEDEEMGYSPKDGKSSFLYSLIEAHRYVHNRRSAMSN